ncbi:patatin-like phospholipase family protein [Staphylococcus croceilyticus]|uniref:Patatin-like phospholipase family protein n=2 Tax=Staphylococcus croceilyticus TaxID=319942 RepID=A0ABY2KIM4_9STAP|nr:phospholipase [Staphylococcus croceilyticus]TGA80778.1 patatin-like phospholipase family protein [Staphylococcus croceilyticus]
MTMTNERTLVLGGGGITGIAWESGVLAGLIDNGIKLNEADKIIGTSAGSFVGAVLANGYDMKDYYYELDERRDENDRASMSSDIYRLWQNAFIVGRDDAEKVGQMMGDIVYTRPSKVDLNERKQAIRQRLGDVEWKDNLEITAINAKTGVTGTFNSQSGVTLEEAVTASGAVPGIWPHIRLNEIDWIDGGMVSPTNAMLAEGAKSIIILAPLADGLGMMPSAFDDAEQLSKHSHVLVISPDSDSQAEIGDNIYNPNNILNIGNVGYKQGQVLAQEIRDNYKEWLH